jgi:hypothetical protein
MKNRAIPSSFTLSTLRTKFSWSFCLKTISLTTLGALLILGIIFFPSSPFGQFPHPQGVIIGSSADTTPALAQLQADFVDIILKHTPLDIYFPQTTPLEVDAPTLDFLTARPAWLDNHRVHVQPCQGQACLWPRDWGVLRNQNTINHPPYFWQLTPHEVPTWQTTQKLQLTKMPPVWPRGDLGGNLLRLTDVLWMGGDTISVAVRNKLIVSSKSHQGPPSDITTVRTAWAMIGHIDELYALAIFTSSHGLKSEGYLFYADPLWGLQLFTEMKEEERLALLLSTREEEERAGGIDLGAQFANEQRQDFREAINLQHRYYQYLAAANTAYAKIINQDLAKFKKVIAEDHFIRLPIFFVPAYLQNIYGTAQDSAVAAYANSVNFWSGENIIITAKWPWHNWQQAVEQQMQKFPGKTFYLDAAVLNRRRGGLHCFTNEVSFETNRVWATR